MLRRTFGTIVPVLVAGCVFVACEAGDGAADRLIVPGERLGPVRLQATRAEVRRLLGEPDGTWVVPNDSGVELDLWGPPGSPHLVVYYRDDRAVQIHATDPAYETADGFSTRSTIDAIRARFAPLQVFVNPYEENTAYYDATGQGIAFVVTYAEDVATGKLLGTTAAVFVHLPGTEVLIY
ncbi:hypothetical protein GQ464_010125 [Rhodocaloribacter litoris]|uniref:hypothetical protein n=1 Tax=Rhodocaloribacter litoris TaxID=2558931 RepID=UPI0014206ADE|nr:hypothetical protein [Rhodocaloribacter litoris]QXD13829.1 hypothetical protein GQ464_010125 [Rhodocaloribacter litoris]